MRASWRVSPAVSVAVTITTLRPSSSASRASSIASTVASASARRHTSRPFTLTATRAMPLPAVTRPLSAASRRLTRRPSAGSRTSTWSGSAATGSTATSLKARRPTLAPSAATNCRTAGAYQARSHHAGAPGASAASGTILNVSRYASNRPAGIRTSSQASTRQVNVASALTTKRKTRR